MSVAFRPLTEIFDRGLLSAFLEDVARMPCAIQGAGGDQVLSFGDQKSIPKLTKEQLHEVRQSPLPVEFEGGKAAGLFAKSEYLGCVTIAVSEGKEVMADFLFQFLSHSVALYMERDEVQFAADYLRNLMSLMRKLSVRTAAVFDKKEVAKIFMEECESLFGVNSGVILVVPKEDAKEVVESFALASFGEKVPADCLRRAEESRRTGRLQMFEAAGEIIVPLTAGMRSLGALCLRGRQMGPYSAEDLHAAQTLGAMLGAMISSIQFYENLVATELVRMNLARYLSPNLLKEVVEPGKFWSLGGKKMRATVLFTDIRGFTKLSETMAAEEMVAQLNEYFEEMSEVIFKYDGTLDKFVGDMIMVLFGVPKEMADAPLRAVKAALEMQARIKVLNENWAKKGKKPFGVGMGINTGDVIFGNIGSQRAMGLTVIGDHVNQAQRLEAHAKAGEVLISDAVYQDLSTQIESEKLGVIEVRGKTMTAHRLLKLR